jgi:hypothetical protein
MDTAMAAALVLCFVLSIAVWVLRMKQAASRIVSKRRYRPTTWTQEE